MDFSYEKTICLILQEEIWPRMIWNHTLKFNSVFFILKSKVFIHCRSQQCLFSEMVLNNK